MAEHESEVCPQRPMDVKMEWFMKSMETKKLTTERERHDREMAAVREEFRNTLTEERETHKKELKQLLAEQKRVTESKIAEQKRQIKVQNHADYKYSVKQDFISLCHVKEEVEELKQLLAEQKREPGWLRRESPDIKRLEQEQ